MALQVVRLGQGATVPKLGRTWTICWTSSIFKWTILWSCWGVQGTLDGQGGRYGPDTKVCAVVVVVFSWIDGYTDAIDGQIHISFLLFVHSHVRLFTSFPTQPTH